MTNYVGGAAGVRADRRAGDGLCAGGEAAPPNATPDPNVITGRLGGSP